MGLGRSVKHERALLRNLATSLIKHESIITTQAKAKLTQGLVENLITKAKKSVGPQSQEKLLQDARIRCGSDLFEHNITLPKLFDVLAPRYLERAGGYTRILKLESRIGDNAPQCILELVDNEDREIKYWLLAKTMARLELQKQPLNDLTKKNLDKLLKHKDEAGKQKFRDIVEICKKEFYANEESLENLPQLKENSNGFNRSLLKDQIVMVPRPRKN
ncbi:hypothetical protein PACTADRAFT_49549 [Pachysolen tannophilus NRRL Y-2460]|uniref:Large ribosomal subunit protein bL17m C-terminal fungi domain-containing protein n=1 Tax=Pachysolen tannophilus NRRL Y-2460 TaxID=669874 RepID=A0A1E4TWP0_PACTA|nr:hypothetical protein PACTADRAFT_49549 [Pachysolen tannophilus NRRL Y-2460]